MASLTLVLKTVKDTTAMTKPGQARINLQKITNQINGIKAGHLIGKLIVTASTVDPVSATATATIATLLAADTITIAKSTFTASATPSGYSQFLVTGTDTQVASALVVKINAHPTVGQVLLASSVGAVITLTSHVPGLVGNQIGLTSSNGTRLAVIGSGFLAGGTGGSGTAPVILGS